MMYNIREPGYAKNPGKFNIRIFCLFVFGLPRVLVGANRKDQSRDLVSPIYWLIKILSVFFVHKRRLDLLYPLYVVA